jgi:hypothetical protein
VDQRLICAPENDLAGCVVGTRSCIAGGLPGLQVKVEKAAAARLGGTAIRRSGARCLPAMLFERWDEALLYRTMGTLRAHAPTIGCLRVAVDRSAPEFQAWWGRSVAVS